MAPNVEGPPAAAEHLQLVEQQQRNAEARAAIYCGGSLLEAVQSAKLFHDCKHFVDMPLKFDAEIVWSRWQELSDNGRCIPDSSTLQDFVSENFDEPGEELEECAPCDFDPNHQFGQIQDPNYRNWAQALHRKWPTLCRKVIPKVQQNPTRYSLLAVPQPFVVPGGRFREMYYWDSFFSIKGLLASGMYDTVRGMIENMGYLIEHYGFIPNGNRIYYLNRSQPPLLTWMVYAYYRATNDLSILWVALKWLKKEQAYFEQNKSMHRDGWPTKLYRFFVEATAPRPESFREDLESSEHIDDLQAKCRLWGDLAAAAESGRDFGSRWFKYSGPRSGELESTRTSQVLPIDLNSIIASNFNLRADMHAAIGEMEEAAACLAEFDRLRDTIKLVFWSEDHGSWFDYDLSDNNQIYIYQDTNFFPMYCRCVHDEFNGESVAKYLHESGALGYPGGLPASLTTTGQQWDFPNAWAPTTYVVVEGLRAYGQEKLARHIADKWIRKNYTLWLNNEGRMFEKYTVTSANCQRVGDGGGEYEMQEGFGWTNGVILDFLLSDAENLRWDGPGPTDCRCCNRRRSSVSIQPFIRARGASISLPIQAPMGRPLYSC